jgi:hypothetical protein
MRVFVVVLALAACDGPVPTEPARFTVWIADDAPAPVQWSADDVESYLTAMGREVTRGEGAAPSACEPGVGNIVFAELEGTDQTWAIHEERCERAGSRVELAGGGLLGRQYAAYEWLHRLGVRFFHPEQEFVPSAPRWPSEPIDVEHTPAFRWRSVSLHLTHPLELGDAFNERDEDAIDDGVRYIDWQIKNGASRGSGGVGDGEHQLRGIERGFPLTAGFSLHNQQQGGRPIIDPDDPRPVNDQIAEAIDAQMTREDGRVPQVFGFTYNPSEFTEIHDEDALAQITFIADYLGEHYPDTLVETICRSSPLRTSA